MTPILARAAPLRFLIGVMLCWTLGRIVLLADWSVAPDGPAARVPQRRGMVKADPGPAPVARRSVRIAARAGSLRHPRRALLTGGARYSVAGVIPAGEARGSEPSFDQPVRAPEVIGIARTIAVPAAAARSRWSGSAWTFLLGAGRTGALAPVGQIGGGQAGARLLYRLDGAGRLAASARLSRALGGPRQTEAAVGLDWTPVARLPLHVMAERRIAIDKGGRDAWTLGVAGGVYAVPLGRRWRLDGYGEAGVVGMRRRDLYADGAVRVARAIGLGGEASLALGGGLWAAAQPGAARFDLGPSAVLRMPVSRRTMSMALDWRERVSGDARPGSGAALTVAMDF
jgi:hypothetical protein